MRKILRTAASLTAGVALSFGALASALPADAASGCGASVKSYAKVQASSRGGAARSAECLLVKAGYAARIDGSFTTADAAVLKKFQSKVGLRASGVVDRPTWTALIAQGPRLTRHVGDRGATVKRLQLALRAGGFGQLSGTGYFGPLTKAAVKSLQRAEGWRQTGTATDGVWRVLQAGGAVHIKAAVAKKKPATKPSAKKATSSFRGMKALAFAKKHLGDRYRFGATGPHAWDCSGLAQGAWKAAGKRIPRTSQAQYRFGKKISKSHLRAGDLVFFYSGISHVAIYAGHGKVIHAPRPGKRVEYILMKYMPYEGARRPG